MFLGACAVVVLLVILKGLLDALGSPTWVVMAAGIVLGLGTLAGVTAALIYLPEWIERRRVRKRDCPSCGQRRWSWGFGRGMGL